MHDQHITVFTPEFVKNLVVGLEFVKTGHHAHTHGRTLRLLNGGEVKFEVYVD